MPVSHTLPPIDLDAAFTAGGVGLADRTPGALTERERFRMRLRRRPLLFDGAMGTLLYGLGIPQRACLDEVVLTHPEVVSTIHREYLEAGADAIETDTFGANRIRLAEFGLEKLAGQMNRRAAQLAREARDVAGREALVAGSIGPLGPPRVQDRLHPGLARAAFREQIEGLLEGGVDLLVCETFGDLATLLAAIEEARRASDLPLIAQMTFGEDLLLADGTTPAAAAAALTEAGVDAIGVNCGAGPLACLEALVRTGPPTPAVARSLQPNAGLPQRVEGRLVYSAEPEYFGEMVPRMIAAGSRIVGGCCGTTPVHTAAMRAAIDALTAVATEDHPGVAVAPRPDDADRENAAAAAPRTPRRELGVEGEAPPPTGLARKLADGTFVISVEIDPPRSIRIDRTFEAARLLARAGVDLVNVSDSATGRVRMGAMAVAFGIQHDLDLECLVHLTTRDRNLMALEAELLGAHALGIRNILALTGDPPRVADLISTRAVWDVDSIGLIEIIRRLNQGEDQAGSAIGQRAGFTVACALDPTAADQDKEWGRLERKLAAGAHLIMTQPLYAPAQVEAMLDRARIAFGQGGFPVPVLLGVLPLHSSRHAEFLHNEVPGITIPDEQRAAMRAAGARGTEVGFEMALDLLERTEGAIQGTYIMPSFGRYELTAELVRRLRARMAERSADQR
ncbi:MAG: bifunctional homocysteine S-methyltransferase/methylenetetrahydrofolate reductase [Candidatus Limnocylindrales bacterium]|jgi:homocysteine S-methyltransferase